MTTQQQTDADLIRDLNDEAEASTEYQSIVDLLRRAAARLSELTQETARLTEALKKANSQAEHFEREWYLRGDKIEELTQPAPQCPDCNDTGERDSGGAYPWGESIYLACDCQRKQPAPLALSAEDAQAWDQYVRLAKQPKGPQNNPVYDRAILAVDALLRKRVTPLTDEQIGELIDKCRADIEQEFLVELIRAAEQAHGIGEGAK